MSSLLDVTFRDDESNQRKSEIASITRAHHECVRDLHAVTRLLTNNTGLSELLTILNNINDSTTIPPATNNDFLQSNTLLTGRHFDETTLPFPTIPHHDTSIYASEPNRPSTQPPQLAHASTSIDGLATKATLTSSAAPARPMAAYGRPKAADGEREGRDQSVGKSAERDIERRTEAISPALAAPPTAEDEANLSPATKDHLRSASPERPAKTVHLPPEDVQEAHLRERHEAEEEARSRSDGDKPGRPSHLLAEAASSPSSTIGAYSATTPMPPQDSPDTSPDSEMADEAMLPPPKDLRPSPEQRRTREEHDRLLEAQKDIARREAFGAPTPDDQLNFEAREAAARDAEEKQARDANGSLDVKHARSASELGVDEVLDVLEQDNMAPSQLPITPAASHDEKTPAPGPKAVQRVSSSAVENDGDNITVTPRSRLPPLDTTRGEEPRTLGYSVNRPARRSSALVNMDDIAGAEPQSSRSLTTPDLVSPMTVRYPRRDVNATPAAIMQTPYKTPRASAEHDSDTTSRSIRDLAPLKGAAEDTERDYLEPLFRIQAHDSPNSQTKPLPELVKSAQKYLSTEDQFTTLHERMDYRILRRIYQLQNANKWSLRQMEKTTEPDTMPTHMDHLTAEMKWMRKDFKAERKMKKSVCAWLAKSCSEWLSASAEARRNMQVKVRPAKHVREEPTIDVVPDLDNSGESAPEDDLPPVSQVGLPRNLVVAPELKGLVCGLHKTGKLGKALQGLPVVSFKPESCNFNPTSINEVSKLVAGKLLPAAAGPLRKRSRYDYADDAEVIDDEPDSKRQRPDRDLAPEDQEAALFHPENKPIRDRLHANNAFRPPSEFVMPATSFYEFRNGSQWIWEDDQKLRKLAKEYTFNWSLIADEMTLPTRYKSSAERRTPWECFERWVELETLPAEMRKTMYFKTWFQRLEQSQQAADRRYQASVAAIQAQAQSGQQVHVPQRRRTIPTRVEKRKSTRYLWLVDAMRKLAKKRENNAYKQAEAQRAAAQRKSANEGNTQPRNGPRLTPQEFSQKRQERDMQIAEAQRQHRTKMMEAQQRQLMQARAAHQQGVAGQQRPGTAVPPQPAQMQAQGQPQPNMNGQFPQQARPPLPMATRNGHLAVPQVNAQGIPQAQMQTVNHMTPQQQQQMARIAHANAQRNAQYGTQPYQMPTNGQMASPGSNMTTAQQLQHNQALLQQMSAQQQQLPQNQPTPQTNGHQQMSNSPSMPPPPTPHNQQQQPGQLSSGHVPALIAIKNNLRAKHPHLSDDQLTRAATDALREQSASATQSSTQARQNAMNAAAGIPAQPQANHQMPNNMQQTYGHNQQAYQSNAQLPNGNATYMNGGDNANAQSQAQNPQAAAAYANQIRQRQQAQMLRMHGSPNGTHAQLNGSPGMAHASPNMAPASPAMAYAGMANGQMGQGANGRPPSRNNGMPGGGLQRMGSNNSLPGAAMGMPNGVQSPGSQASPRMQASMAR
ncbi:RNA polymerase II transcription elongation factor SpEAF [Recurvomyces mirabilis]|uniref:Vacuolar import and degradation protein 21 n=1 Tax=Recurvomyces mirabilis TaxID=574656 RepID=A0AAE0WU32_9PEZI|nr:RNA polymerase II transcription elongation factor SpEAF [Recurvomyces mirabilis]KAK5157394.1 RNA polymerase II transcription elongation factor SpEAF [Recurvomyces mirabilis]